MMTDENQKGLREMLTIEYDYSGVIYDPIVHVLVPVVFRNHHMLYVTVTTCSKYLRHTTYIDY